MNEMRKLTNSRPEEFEVFHQSLRFVFGVKNREFREHSHVSSLETEPGFEKRDELVGVTSVLVKLDERLKFLGMNDEIETTDLSESELLLVDTSSVNLFPDSAGTRAAKSVLAWTLRIRGKEF